MLTRAVNTLFVGATSLSYQFKTLGYLSLIKLHPKAYWYDFARDELLSGGEGRVFRWLVAGVSLEHFLTLDGFTAVNLVENFCRIRPVLKVHSLGCQILRSSF